MENPYFGRGMQSPELADVPFPSANAAKPAALLARCPEAAQTPLRHIGAFAGAGDVYVKDERGRMGLGSFKALGAAYVIACDAEDGRAKGQTYVCASAGNHGLSVATGARVFGAKSIVYLSRAVPQSFAKRLGEAGAEVRRIDGSYEDSMAAAQACAEQEGAVLLSDSSWPGYVARPHRLMEGYTVMAAEAAQQMPDAPTHIFLQAGVGGLAAACAACFRDVWGDAPQIIVVEPEAAPALHASIKAGGFTPGSGPDSIMGRLDCKEASLIALKGLARDANRFTLISEEAVADAMPVLAAQGLETSPSGGAGLAAALQDESLGADARVLCILSEGPA